MKTKNVRLPVELADRVDSVRGDVPRDRWVRRLIEKEIGLPQTGARVGGQPEGASRGRTPAAASGRAGSTPAEPAPLPKIAPRRSA